jgi:hypothetical protein
MDATPGFFLAVSCLYFNMSRPVPVIEARTTTTTEIRVTGFPCCHHDPSQAAAEPPSQTDFARPSDPVPTVYTLSYLPPPDLLSKALDSFYSCSGTLFSLIPRSESFALFRSVYWGSSTRSGGTVAELCALAAVGGHYDNDGCPEVHRNALFATAKVFVHELEDLRQMRVYALFTMFSIMEKRIASWSYVCNKSPEKNWTLVGWLTRRKQWDCGLPRGTACI